ncbi:MAG: DUF3325 family protein [Bermanella sp.]
MSMYIASLWVLLSCILFSLSIKRHYVCIIDETNIPHHIGTKLCRVGGFLCLILSFILLFNQYGTALGLVYLAALFTVASLIQTLLLSYLTNRINKIIVVLVVLTSVLLLPVN